MRSATGRTAARVAAFMIGTTTTWNCAKRGGTTKPRSSECAMISAPTSRVETPHEVAHTYSSVLSRVWNWTSNALAKF